MDDTPYIHDGADASLRKTVSLLNKIEAKTGSATITGPVTVTNEVEIKNDANNPLPVSDNGGSLTVDGTVELGATSLSALENISVTFPATQNVNVTNAGLSVSVSNLPATQPVSGSVSVSNLPATQPISGSISVSNLPATQAISGTIGTFASALVNAGSTFSYSAVGSYGVFDAGVDADYVEFKLDGGGGGFTHNLSISSSNSPYSAVNSTAASLVVFNDKFPSSSLDTTAYRFSNTSLTSGQPGTYVLSLWSGGVRYRYVRVEVTGGGGGSWTGRFDSFKSAGLSAGAGSSSRIVNRIPIAGVVDINSCTRELPVNDSALISSVGTTSEAAAVSDLAVSSISGLFRRLLQRLTTLLPANLTVSSTRLLVDGSGVTQPVSLASAPVTPVTDNGGSLTVDGTVTANVSGTVPVSGTFWQTTQPISGTVNTYPQQGTTATNTDFSSLTSAQLAPAVANRESLTVYNEGSGTLFINVGASCSTTSYQVRLLAGDYWEAPQGQVSLQHSGIFGTSGTGRVTQVS